MIAVDTWNPLLVPRFLEITEIIHEDQTFHFTTYEALAGEQVRGVMYDIDPRDTSEVLLDAIESDTHRIISVRPMGREGKAALIIFEGKHLPRYVKYHPCLKRVATYHPRTVVCSNAIASATSPTYARTQRPAAINAAAFTTL